MLVKKNLYSILCYILTNLIFFQIFLYLCHVYLKTSILRINEANLLIQVKNLMH